MCLFYSKPVKRERFSLNVIFYYSIFSDEDRIIGKYHFPIILSSILRI